MPSDNTAPPDPKADAFLDRILSYDPTARMRAELERLRDIKPRELSRGPTADSSFQAGLAELQRRFPGPKIVTDREVPAGHRHFTRAEGGMLALGGCMDRACTVIERRDPIKRQSTWEHRQPGQEAHWGEAILVISDNELIYLPEHPEEIVRARVISWLRRCHAYAEGRTPLVEEPADVR